MSRIIVLFYYFTFVSVISGRGTKSGFLLLGGEDGNGITGHTLNNVEAYGSDLSLPFLPHLPLGLSGPIAEMAESGAIYIAGGFGGGSGGSTNDITFFLSNLSSPKWEMLEARMPVPVEDAGSVIVGDILLVLGGSNTNAIQMLNTNKTLPTWELLNQTLPEPLDGHSAVVFEGQVIIVTDQGVTYTTSVSSIISDTQLDWVKGKLHDVKTVRWGPSVEVCGDKLVAVYGRQVFTKTTMNSNWNELEHLPEEKKDYPSIGSVRGNIVIAGGWNDGDHSARDTVFMWLEVSSKWKKVNSLKSQRRFHATVQLPRGKTPDRTTAAGPDEITAENTDGTTEADSTTIRTTPSDSITSPYHLEVKDRNSGFPLAIETQVNEHIVSVLEDMESFCGHWCIARIDGARVLGFGQGAKIAPIDEGQEEGHEIVVIEEQ